MGRKVIADNTEPEESNFKIPSEGEKLLQIVDVNPLKRPDGSDDEDIQIVNLELVGGEEEGLTLLQRININSNEKSFYYARLFLKAISEPYKGEFEIYPENWVGKQFYATIKHTKSKYGTKTYANIGEYNFTKVIEQYKPPVGSNNPGGITDPKDIQWQD